MPTSVEAATGPSGGQGASSSWLVPHLHQGVMRLHQVPAVWPTLRSQSPAVKGRTFCLAKT